MMMSYNEVVHVEGYYLPRRPRRHRCMSARNPHTHTNIHTQPNPETSPRVWVVFLQHEALTDGHTVGPHACRGLVCLCFAPLEISMQAACALQRDDKLQIDIQSCLEVRATRHQVGSPDEGDGVFGQAGRPMCASGSLIPL